jgi:hypothetical protein
MATQIHMRTEKQERQNEEMKRLVEWISKHWDEWKMLCNPAITDTDTRAKRRKWVSALKSLVKADFPSLILVFMTKCYYMEGRAKQVIEGAVVQRILSTWDETIVDEFISYLSKVDYWDARELPASEETKEKKEKKEQEEINSWLNSEKER